MDSSRTLPLTLVTSPKIDEEENKEKEFTLKISTSASMQNKTIKLRSYLESSQSSRKVFLLRETAKKSYNRNYRK